MCVKKGLTMPPPSLLRPLPVPHRPWSDILYLWTLSLGYRPLKVTLPFELLLTDFPRWSISFPCANYLPPRGLRRQFFPKFYGFMVSLKLWYQTGDLSSFLSSLRPSVSSAAPHQSLLRIPFPVKRPGGVAESGTGELPTVPCLPESSQNPATWSKHLIWVEFSHPTQFIYRLFSISVCLWLPASTIPRSRDGGQHPLCPEVHPLMPLDLKWGL